MFKFKRKSLSIVGGVILGGLMVTMLLVAVLGTFIETTKADWSSQFSKSAIVGKVAVVATPGQTLTAYCGRTKPFMFKGYVTFDSANSGSNYIQATITGASNVTAAAGTTFPCNAIDSDSIIILGSAADYINIVGEEVKGGSNTEVYARPLADGGWAVGLFNKTSSAKTTSITWEEIDDAVTTLKGTYPSIATTTTLQPVAFPNVTNPTAAKTIRNIWSATNETAATGYTATDLPAYGCVFLRVGA